MVRPGPLRGARAARGLLIAALAWTACRRAPAVDVAGATDEIEALLQRFEQDGVALERNGAALAPAASIRWLRAKWRRRNRHVLSAEDFIRNVASRSTGTKRPYQVVLPGGGRVASAQWFQDRLAEIRAARR